ncbi:monofunctional biosynthetic peptidoglycan transglycosylase [Variovorax sp. NFACC27]|uniref:Biosynthetic peptidoglycan transglycosylase n=1 Tax=Variovorax gossypii TaxID=1679495 RepID=A0A431TLT3_9BURK|nr:MULTISPECIES: monofunctional biosynthetic peptidoglycan transglycosylase [Variovorax]MDP9604369.1 monofunctional biosynthetic peptidoglycan transglycosylase [Variovorax paradoxus]SEF20435.1 monofunctional biosynthetic peptidoglycan transglycosylase [Variovorax sp. NFACC28]SEF58622.1 monofunctional biosynthetic peptidoglycan transglycosylase [Variovorax sp. NFACC29]SFB71670.1 monofunctional biosynthetic peptidoglycan transglycosylase [Variovorax sp. NFACC26]SFG57505.1 monofunctional biosynth
MKAALRLIACIAVAGLALQLFFVARIAAMAVIDPQSTAFQRSEAYQIAIHQGSGGGWRQEWVPYSQINDTLKRAVIASEDSGFVDHNGVEWEAIERARQRNARAEELAAKRAARAAARGRPVKPVQLRGGSTITQQLAKNLLLSGERTMLRKGQELVLATLLEVLLDKRRILEIYLNNVEWGEGVFGAQAASQYYFRKPASRLGTGEAARLAVMLPSPKFFERRTGSPYLSGRASTVMARMPAAELP